MPERRRNKKWMWAVAGILLVAAVVVAVVVWLNNRDNSGASSSSSSSSSVVEKTETVKKTEEKKESVNSAAEQAAAAEALQRPEQYGGESPNEANVLTGVVNYASLNTAGDTLTIRTSIYQYLESGTCELVLMRGDNVAYQETVEIVAEATTSTCKGFDIPATSLAGPAYSINIYLSSGEKTGVITGEVAL